MSKESIRISSSNVVCCVIVWVGSACEIVPHYGLENGKLPYDQLHFNAFTGSEFNIKNMQAGLPNGNVSTLLLGKIICRNEIWKEFRQTSLKIVIDEM